MTAKQTLLVVVSLVVVFATTTISCANYRYAVLLWPTQEITDGIDAVYRIRSIDTINNTATFLSDDGKRITLEQWRLSIFDNKNEAVSFHEAYDTWKYIYARCELRALPIRSEQNRFSDIVYRLQEGEIIKIINRADEPSDEAGFKDYWYEVLTKTGQRGWVFGYYLSLVDETVDNDFGSNQGDSQLTFFLNNVWRPVSFQYMADSGYIDTNVFTREYGLFAFPVEQIITINTQDYLVRFGYNSSEIQPDGGLFFIGDDSQLAVSFSNPEQIEINYSSDSGGSISDSFVLFNRDIEQIRNQAVAELRSQIFDILEVGNQFRTNRNEWLIIRSDGSFTASIQQISIPSVGSLSFALYLSPSLSQRYDGIIGFIDQQSATTTHYAYTLSQQAIVLFPIEIASGVVVDSQHIVRGTEVVFTAY